MGHLGKLCSFILMQITSPAMSENFKNFLANFLAGFSQVMNQKCSSKVNWISVQSYLVFYNVNTKTLFIHRSWKKV